MTTALVYLFAGLFAATTVLFLIAYAGYTHEVAERRAAQARADVLRQSLLEAHVEAARARIGGVA